MKGSEYLYEMCKNVRNESNSAKGFLNPITPRVNYIIYSLSSEGISCEIDVFEAYNKELKSDSNKLVNVIVEFESDVPNASTIVLSAHHDIANPNSENCQDNTASVCNLLELCSILSDLPKGYLKYNVVIAFTDCEEVGGRGMNRLVQQILEGTYGNVEFMYALELTACGNKFWVSGANKESDIVNVLKECVEEKEISIVRTPYNESVNARTNGLNACCIGILTESEMNIAKSTGYCDTWGLCHSMEDTYEKSVIVEDMDNFVLTLLKLLTIKL